MMLIDTHCHLYHKNFDNDLQDVAQRALNNSIQKIFLPAIDSESHEKLIQLSQKVFNIQHSALNTQHSPTSLSIYPMMGLHPCSIKENFEDELKIVEQYFDSGTKFYAIGEIGLDYYWDVAFKQQQIHAFEKQISWAVEKKLPIVIHSRESTADCIASVKKFAGKVSGIFHCFSGTLEEAKQICDLGFYLGIGGVATYKKAGLKEMLPATGLENLVLETDAPYLSPIPYRGKRNEPAYIRLIAETVADAFQKSLEEIAQVTTANALKVFQLNS